MRPGARAVWPSMLASKPVYTITATALLLFCVWSVGLLRLPSSTGSLQWPHPEPSLLPPAHPVERLYLQAKHDHEDMVARQSKSYQEAAQAYEKRYKKSVPSGFDRWFEYAQQWQSPVIDDFDDIERGLAPFRAYLRSGCDEPRLGNDPSSDRKVIQLCFEGGNILQYGWREKWWEEALEKMVKEFQQSIPNICINLNYLDEPRILLPEHLLHAAESKAQGLGCHPFDFVRLGRQNAWSEIAVACPVDAPNRVRPHDSTLNQTLYAEDFGQITDVCAYDRSLPQGMLLSSESLRVTHDVVPVLSGSKMSAFADVLFPAPFRFESQSNYKQEEDRNWEDKKSVLHWRGSTTGGHGVGNNWQHFHRQNLVQKLAEKNNSAIDVSFTAVTQCEEDACHAQEQFFHLEERTEMESNWEYKWILDMDGNGLSGRLYDLLRSKSLVLRHTFMREWHDQRLRPWFHYIPISSHFEEIDDLLAFLSTPRGDEIARSIAEEGSKWVYAAMRQEDMVLYFYRLLLEMARDRKAPG